MPEAIHQEIDFTASPKRIYEALMDSKQHAEFTANGGTRLIVDHAGFPAGDAGHLASGWHERCWGPLHRYLA